MNEDSQLIQKVLGNPAKYPLELQSWIYKVVSRALEVQVNNEQLPSLLDQSKIPLLSNSQIPSVLSGKTIPAEAVRIFGATGQPALQNSFTQQVPASGGFYMDPAGTVFLAGFLIPPAVPTRTIMATLPSGYRPPADTAFAIYALGSGIAPHPPIPAFIQVLATGDIEFIDTYTAGTTITLFSLGGISFHP